MTDTQQPREVVAEDFAAVNSGSYAGEEWQARVDLAAMYRLSAHFGYDDTIWNHITMRVPGSCLLYTSPSPRDLSTSRMPSSA